VLEQPDRNAAPTGGRVVWVSFDDIGRDCMLAAAEHGANAVGIVTLPGPGSTTRSGQCSFEEPARSLGAPVIETKDVNDPIVVEAVANLRPDMIFVVGWSQLIRAPMISTPPLGVYGMHPTLLPRHRGRAPIPWAILSGLAKTGVTLFQILDETADSGLLVGQREVPIDEEETATTLYAKVKRAHIELMRESIPALLAGAATRTEQDERRASWWPKRMPRDGIIDWNMRSRYVHDWIRAQTHPYPGAFTYLGDQRLVVWRARTGDTAGSQEPGRVLRHRADGVLVACGDGTLALQEVEFEDGSIAVGASVGQRIEEGAMLG